MPELATAFERSKCQVEFSFCMVKLSLERIANPDTRGRRAVHPVQAGSPRRHQARRSPVSVYQRAVGGCSPVVANHCMELAMVTSAPVRTRLTTLCPRRGVVPGRFVHNLVVTAPDERDTRVQPWIGESQRIMGMRQRLRKGPQPSGERLLGPGRQREPGLDAGGRLRRVPSRPLSGVAAESSTFHFTRMPPNTCAACG